MAEINLIQKEEIPNLKFSKLNWDVVMNGKAYQVIKVKDHAHCIGGKLDYGEGNNLWAYPLNEEMTYENLVEFDGVPGARWGFEYKPAHYIRNKWDEVSIERGRKLIITRNDEVFYDEFMTIHEMLAYVLDNKLDEHPLDLNERDFDKKCVGRKVWYRSQPAIIDSFVNKRACVILKPDGIDEFSKPNEYDNDDYWEECKDEVMTSIFDQNIYWFRD